MKPGEWRTMAKSWLMRAGFVATHAKIVSLAEELRIVERSGARRGERLVLDLVARHLGVEAHALVAKHLDERSCVTSSDGVAQPAEDVANQHGTTAPAGRS